MDSLKSTLRQELDREVENHTEVFRNSGARYYLFSSVINSRLLQEERAYARRTITRLTS